MKSVTIIPNQKKLHPRDLNHQRTLLAMKCLWELVAAAKKQVDIATWIGEGGLDAEDLLEAIDEGQPHPTLEDWQDRREKAGRPGPSKREKFARHFAGLLCLALQRTGLNKRQARQRVANALAPLAEKFALDPPSKHTIERWQRAVQLTPEDEQVISNALAKAGDNPALVAETYFTGLIHLALDPLALIAHDVR